MTVAAAWIRKVNQCEELILVSDSRLCGGHRWDECPKIFTLPRGDCAICFAGCTDYAYPIMIQLYFMTQELIRINTRSMDIVELNGYILKHVNHLWQSVYDKVDVNDISENEFIFCGYSWVSKTFKIWRYIYSKSDGCFRQCPSNNSHMGCFGKIAVVGDMKRDFVRKLNGILFQRYGIACRDYSGNGFNMEPFETMKSMLQESDGSSTIGGAPQMVKIYQHMNCRPIGIYWPEKTSNAFENRTLIGRKMFTFEDTEFWFMDPNTFVTNQCHKATLANG